VTHGRCRKKAEQAVYKLSDQQQIRLLVYRKKDYRSKCSQCRRWMRFKPTLKTPATRRSAPNAGRCTDCPVKKRRKKMRKLLPPRLADWTKGHTQIGFFVRTREGNVIEFVNNNLSTPGACKEVRELLTVFLDDDDGGDAKREAPVVPPAAPPSVPPPAEDTPVVEGL